MELRHDRTIKMVNFYLPQICQRIKIMRAKVNLGYKVAWALKLASRCTDCAIPGPKLNIIAEKVYSLLFCLLTDTFLLLLAECLTSCCIHAVSVCVGISQLISQFCSIMEADS
jgi:hypothetical protein